MSSPRDVLSRDEKPQMPLFHFLSPFFFFSLADHTTLSTTAPFQVLHPHTLTVARAQPIVFQDSSCYVFNRFTPLSCDVHLPVHLRRFIMNYIIHKQNKSRTNCILFERVKSADISHAVYQKLDRMKSISDSNNCCRTLQCTDFKIKYLSFFHFLISLWLKI